MKKILFLAVAALTVALGGVVRAATDMRPAAITVVNVQGEARYSTDGKAWHALVIGKILRAGAVIETAANSSADLVLSGTPVPLPEKSSNPLSWSSLSTAPDPNVRGFAAFKPMSQQNVIRMQADTMLAVDKLTVVDTGNDTVSDTELDLRAGKIFTSVKKLSADSQYIIKLPNGVAGVRGAALTLSADGTAFVLHGIVVLSIIGPNGQPHVIVVHGGYGFDVLTGKVVTLSPEALSFLNNLSIGVHTVFVTYTSISPNLVLQFISTTQGIEVNNSGGSGGEGGEEGGG
jgi:hypothetical protein